MNRSDVDAWLSGEEGTRVVEAAAKAIWRCRYSEGDPDFYLPQARAALRAALSLTTTCARCDDTGEVLGMSLHDEAGHPMPCPDCKGGTVPGEPALLGALVEQIGWVSAWTRDGAGNYARYEIGTPKFNALWEVGPKAGVEPVYRLRPLEKEDET